MKTFFITAAALVALSSCDVVSGNKISQNSNVMAVVSQEEAAPILASAEVISEEQAAKIIKKNKLQQLMETAGEHKVALATYSGIGLAVVATGGFVGVKKYQIHKLPAKAFNKIASKIKKNSRTYTGLDNLDSFDPELNTSLSKEVVNDNMQLGNKLEVQKAVQMQIALNESMFYYQKLKKLEKSSLEGKADKVIKAVQYAQSAYYDQGGKTKKESNTLVVTARRDLYNAMNELFEEYMSAYGLDKNSELPKEILQIKSNTIYKKVDYRNVNDYGAIMMLLSNISKSAIEIKSSRINKIKEYQGLVAQQEQILDRLKPQ